MNSKERVIKTLNGEVPDRVPIGEFAIDFDTVEKILGRETYLRAKAKSQIAFWEGRHEEVAESYLKDHIKLHEKLDLDIITFPMATWIIPEQTDDVPPRKINDNTWEDKYGRIYKYSNITEDITCVKDPVQEQEVYGINDFTGDPAVSLPNERSWQIVDKIVKKFKGVRVPARTVLNWVHKFGKDRNFLKELNNIASNLGERIRCIHIH